MEHISKSQAAPWT